jgi:hypothetical protein
MTLPLVQEEARKRQALGDMALANLDAAEGGYGIRCFHISSSPVIRRAAEKAFDEKGLEFFLF